MTSEEIDQLTEALARAHVVEELSYKGQGLKLDNKESVEKIVQEIVQCRGLKALSLEGNTIGVEAAQTIAKALESKKELVQCHWNDIFTGRLRSEIPPALMSLSNALMTSGARLIELDLSDNAFGPDGVKAFETLLKSPVCYTLHKLRLNNCGMGIGGGNILSSALIECYNQSSATGSPLQLKVFVAGRNRLENDGAIALARAFKLIGTLEEIHIPQNGIGPSGIMALALALEHNPHLRVLNLNDNTFTKTGAVVMAQTLKHLRNLQVVNFGDCLVRSKGALALAAALGEGLPVLKELDLSFGEISVCAAMEVAMAVRDKTDLEKLNLNGNCLGEDGCEALRKTMERMNKADVLGSLSEDEGELDGDEEEVQEKEEEMDKDEVEVEKEKLEKKEEEGNCLKGIDNGYLNLKDHIEGDRSTLKGSLCSPFLLSFLNSPTQEKLLSLGAKRTQLIEQQLDFSDAAKIAQTFLQISSVYNEDPEVKQAVFETTDALLRKAFSNPHFPTYLFVSSLMVNMGLLKGEEKKKLCVLPGHLFVLEHCVGQDYFPVDQADLLDALLSLIDQVLKDCSTARDALKTALKKRITA